MKIVRFSMLLAAFLMPLLFSFNQGYKKVLYLSSTQNLDHDSIIIDKIYRLREVQARDQYLRTLTKGRQGVSIMITTNPSHEAPFYLIQVGYNNSSRFEVYYNFRINNKFIKMKKIMPYIEVLNSSGDFVMLSTWRRTRHI